MNNWQNFMVIMGTAAATLTGLMFVATTLVAGIDQRIPTLNAGISAFNTPTVVHFCAVLLLAGILSVPWQGPLGLGLLLGLAGLGGVGYLAVVARRMRHLSEYRPPLKDWLWYFAIPLFAYLALVIAAVAFLANPALTLYFIAAVMLMLLFIGIHNAWDLVTYLAVERSHAEEERQE